MKISLRYPLILASGSPRRQELLRQLGITFRVAPTHVRELEAKEAKTLSVEELVWINAFRKGHTARLKNPHSAILSADTVVALKKTIFGKPRNITEAHRFLGQLSGHTHQVYTAMILLIPNEPHLGWVEKTDVTFRRLSKSDIQEYVRTVHVLDKAGAYTLQEKGSWIISHIQGSYTNVVGLPIAQLAKLLKPWAKIKH